METPESPVDACVRTLVEARALSPEDAARARKAARGGESALAAACRLGLIPASRAAAAAAEALDLPLMSDDAVAALPGPPDAGAPQRGFVAAHQLALAPTEDGGLVAALADPFDDHLRRAISMATDRPVAFKVATAAGIAAWRAARLAPRPSAAPADAAPAAAGAAVEAIDALLETAARLGASDLHLEPAGEGGAGRARARVDGAMRVIGALDAATYPAALARAKVLARLDVAERRLPQDGRARLTLAGRRIDLRLSTAPAIGGETLAIRLLDPEAAPGDLSLLGFPAEYADVVAAASAAPHGLFLLTGPTGAGKTTTLHAALSGLNSAERKIMTVEDPVEYALPGVVQMQVRPEIGFDFARAQRAMLRHNPDVMMVGEIRDRESASIAVQAALTGHLVLSTVHANSAAGAAIRLLDLGVEPFLLAAALIGAGAQRLARRLCPDCAEPVAPDPAALARIGAPPAGDWRRAPGCARCGGTGVRGRAPVAEAFLASRAFSDAARGPAPSEAALSALTGATSLRQAALTLAASGTISLEEALRVAPPPAA
ncbi:GspE/PulE family protein [Pikeienuella sp. HZG-20]|uniref:GspE/PulE family protein n=1 Tax=Paludibacillus litoralis TaxID=3133267 RepID=UPI0030EBDA73